MNRMKVTMEIFDPLCGEKPCGARATRQVIVEKWEVSGRAGGAAGTGSREIKLYCRRHAEKVLEALHETARKANEESESAAAEATGSPRAVAG